MKRVVALPFENSGWLIASSRNGWVVGTPSSVSVCRPEASRESAVCRVAPWAISLASSES